jgi:hypothetical protein
VLGLAPSEWQDEKRTTRLVMSSVFMGSTLRAFAGYLFGDMIIVDMVLDPIPVTVLVREGLASIADARVATVLREHLVEPRPCLLAWDYGHPHAEFPEPRYPGFIVAIFASSGTGIAYSAYGFGPAYPWGLVFIDNPAYGMDSGWYATLEAAFRESMAWDEPSRPGYEVD